LFFRQKKSTADAHGIICETYGENVIAIRTNYANLNDLKTVISISDKERSERPAVVEQDKLRRQFYCNKKIAKKRIKTFALT